MHFSKLVRETVFTVLIVELINECGIYLHQKSLFHFVKCLAILLFKHAVPFISWYVIV